ncbi:hypothetical protein [Phycicoccus jejuensis]|uniref:hypothetical protein n=1 Tax=Phycicoccus jejuensis TaxID=367299 RepID=UPI0004C30934|nr:hypothetical protein [Phycicoccus jejuensis]
MPTFGTRTNPAHFVEIADPANPGQVKRPGPGAILQARSYPEGVGLSDIAVEDYGYWDAIFDPDAITVSGDGGVTWVGPLFSAEATLAAISAGLDVETALAQSTRALAAAEDALRLAEQGGGGTGGGPITIEKVTATDFTLRQIHARDDRLSIPVEDIAGPDVIYSGLYEDLKGVPPKADLVGGKVPQSQLPPAGTLMNPIPQNPDGTYPPRSSVTLDATRSVFYRQLFTSAEPPRTTDGSGAYAPDPAAGIPGDFLIVGGAL